MENPEEEGIGVVKCALGRLRPEPAMREALSGTPSKAQEAKAGCYEGRKLMLAKHFVSLQNLKYFPSVVLHTTPASLFTLPLRGNSSV